MISALQNNFLRKRNSFTQSDWLHLKIYTVSVSDNITKATACNLSVINFITTVDISIFQVAELKAHMPMEMLRMIKRTFRDALGKLLNSKPLSLIIYETQQKYLCTLMKTLDIISVLYIYQQVYT